MTKLQGRFRPRKREYFEKRFLPAYSTGFKVPETRGSKNFLFFQNSIRRSLKPNLGWPNLGPSIHVTVDTHKFFLGFASKILKTENLGRYLL